MLMGELLINFVARFIMDKFYGTVTIRFEARKVTHVETETRRAWRYQDSPDEVEREHSEVVCKSPS